MDEKVKRSTVMGAKTIKSSRDTFFLVLSLIIMFGSRLLPGMGGLSSEAMGVLGVFLGSLIMMLSLFELPRV